MSGYKTKVEKYYGAEVIILYNPDSFEIVKLKNILMKYLTFVAIFIFESCILVYDKVKNHKVEQTI